MHHRSLSYTHESVFGDALIKDLFSKVLHSCGALLHVTNTAKFMRVLLEILL